MILKRTGGGEHLHYIYQLKKSLDLTPLAALSGCHHGGHMMLGDLVVRSHAIFKFLAF